MNVVPAGHTPDTTNQITALIAVTTTNVQNINGAVPLSAGDYISLHASAGDSAGHHCGWVTGYQIPV